MHARDQPCGEARMARRRPGGVAELGKRQSGRKQRRLLFVEPLCAFVKVTARRRFRAIRSLAPLGNV